MRNFLMIFVLLCSVFTSCNTNKKLANDYLSKYYDNYEIVSCSETDSLFSPYRFEIENECLQNIYNLKIMKYEMYKNNALYDNDKNLYDIYVNKIDSINNKIYELEKIKFEIYTKYNEQTKNRVGFKVKYNVSDCFGNKKEHTFIFVLNQDGKSIGHLMNQYTHSTFTLKDNKVYGFF